MPGEDGIHHGEQRLGEIGQNERNRQQEDSPVPIGHVHYFRIQGFTFLNRLQLAADEHFAWVVPRQGLKPFSFQFVYGPTKSCPDTKPGSHPDSNLTLFRRLRRPGLMRCVSISAKTAGSSTTLRSGRDDNFIAGSGISL